MVDPTRRTELKALSIWVSQLLGYPIFFLSPWLTHLTQGSPLNFFMFMGNPLNISMFQGNPLNPLPGLGVLPWDLEKFSGLPS